MSDTLSKEIEAFHGEIKRAGIIDPDGVHHEFVSGMHGQKIDFERISVNSELYWRWIGVNVLYIVDMFDRLPEVVIGVANGTNKPAMDIATALNPYRETSTDPRIIGLKSQKDGKNSKIITLGKEAMDEIGRVRPEKALIIEDVGTTGSNSVQVAQAALDAGAQSVDVLVTWQRQESLVRLEELGIPYRAIIKDVLPTYSPGDCLARGFCSRQGWDLVPRS